jgi:hypothetical protein
LTPPWVIGLCLLMKRPLRIGTSVNRLAAEPAKTYIPKYYFLCVSVWVCGHYYIQTSIWILGFVFFRGLPGFIENPTAGA